jgi:hypothetical protein
MKKIIKRWLEKLETANKENFGSEPLDCCTVGRNKNNSKTIKTTQSKK